MDILINIILIYYFNDNVSRDVYKEIRIHYIVMIMCVFVFFIFYVVL